ncbi:MAG TPA: hypothetical protein VNA69_17925 [Thermoanaerobaculia bacterium]|nr:hypothetical protein [Thermoanaerobaculia bacterium]
MRALFVVFALAASSLSAQTFDLQGYVAARGVNATGPDTWLTGDVGRLESGDDRNDFLGVAQLGFDWTPSKWLAVHVSGVARREPEDFGGDAVGLIEAYADLRTSFGNEELQLRAGQFFLPTSRENKDELWTSPYAISFSALNTWIAQEVRPAGIDLQWRHTLQRGHVITAAATAFEGNDTMGALLAWRGWSIGNRLSAYDEVLPLPPLPELGTFFADQRDDGTKPFGRDLDDNIGYSARVRYSVPQRANIQYAYVDNRADRRFYRGEYAWATDFHLVSAEAGNPDDFTIAAEYMTGTTGMGFAPAFVQADFYAAYVLLSEKQGRSRFTARYDLFGTQEQDFSVAGGNDESGRSWTLAWLFDVTERARAAFEFTQMTGHRADADMTGRSWTVEMRYTF